MGVSLFVIKDDVSEKLSFTGENGAFAGGKLSTTGGNNQFIGGNFTFIGERVINKRTRTVKKERLK